MCGRRKLEKEYPEIKWGDMDYELVKRIAHQLPNDIVVQFHDNGEPLLYPSFGEALLLFQGQVRCLDTNGKLLLEKAGEIIGNLDTITISTFEKDPECYEQLSILKKFLKIKGDRKPGVIIRCLGDVQLRKAYEETGCIIANRVLHAPEGSFKYRKPPAVPEIGICLDFLNHFAIKRDGYVAHCVRFDPHRKGIIGDANTTSLEDIWNGKVRALYKSFHIKGERKKVPLCETCDYWGCPTA